MRRVRARSPRFMTASFACGGNGRASSAAEDRRRGRPTAPTFPARAPPAQVMDFPAFVCASGKDGRGAPSVANFPAAPSVPPGFCRHRPVWRWRNRAHPQHRSPCARSGLFHEACASEIERDTPSPHFNRCLVGGRPTDSKSICGQANEWPPYQLAAAFWDLAPGHEIIL